MTPDQVEWIPKILNEFPEVEWDRCAGVMDEFVVYGWIRRDDGRDDFLVITFDRESAVSFVTSSAKLSRSFMLRLHGFADGHSDCERVEHVFGDRVSQAIRL